MDTVSKLSAVADNFDWQMNFVGVPKTIDNDLAVTDHTPPCYGSCAKYIATDISESFGVGEAAVKAALCGDSKCMMCIIRNDGEEYSVSYKPFDVSMVANQIKYVPSDFINEEGNGVTDKCIGYMLPLVNGEAPYYTKNGLPEFITLPL